MKDNENSKKEMASLPQPPSQKNRKRGRPRWQTPDLEIVERMASRGLTDKQIAQALGICHDTLIKHKRENVEFFESIQRGKALGLYQISNSLFAEAFQGNTTAAIFYLRCRDRQNWNDRPCPDQGLEVQPNNAKSVDQSDASNS